MKGLKFNIIIFTLLFVASCSTNDKNLNAINKINTNTNSFDKSFQVENFLDIPKLANKSSAEIDKAIGNPTRIQPKQLNSLKKGTIREYKLEKIECKIGFYQDKAVEFVCNLGQNAKFEDPKIVMRSFGFEISNDNKYAVSTDQTYVWKGTFGGTDFYSIVVSKGNSGHFSKILAQVKY